MMRVWPAAVSRVKEEVSDMAAIAAEEKGPSTIDPWDYLFYAEKVRKKRYDLDQAELKPYFEVNNMVAAAMWSAERRYDISFEAITGRVPVFHPDVRVWEVKARAATATGACSIWTTSHAPANGQVHGPSVIASSRRCRPRRRRLRRATTTS
jgi:peptidyl-dipeptidase Dcp